MIENALMLGFAIGFLIGFILVVVVLGVAALR